MEHLWFCLWWNCTMWSKLVLKWHSACLGFLWVTKWANMPSFLSKLLRSDLLVLGVFFHSHPDSCLLSSPARQPIPDTQAFLIWSLSPRFEYVLPPGPPQERGQGKQNSWRLLLQDHRHLMLRFNLHFCWIENSKILKENSFCPVFWRDRTHDLWLVEKFPAALNLHPSREISFFSALRVSSLHPHILNFTVTYLNFYYDISSSLGQSLA